MIDGDLVVRFIMASGAVGTLVTGYVLSKRGQADTREQQKAATALQTRVNTVDELESVISHLKAERDHLIEERDRARVSRQEDQQRQAERCQRQLDSLIGTLATLQVVVQDEIARSAALDDVQGAQQHQRDEHGQDGVPY